MLCEEKRRLSTALRQTAFLLYNRFPRSQPELASRLLGGGGNSVPGETRGNPFPVPDEPNGEYQNDLQRHHLPVQTRGRLGDHLGQPRRRLALRACGQVFRPHLLPPRFFLPASGQYLEVKGQMDAAAIVKAVALCTYEPPLRFQTEDTPDIPLVMAEPGGCFWGYRRPGMEVSLLRCLRWRRTH